METHGDRQVLFRLELGREMQLLQTLRLRYVDDGLVHFLEGQMEVGVTSF